MGLQDPHQLSSLLVLCSSRQCPAANGSHPRPSYSKSTAVFLVGSVHYRCSLLQLRLWPVRTLLASLPSCVPFSPFLTPLFSSLPIQSAFGTWQHFISAPLAVPFFSSPSLQHWDLLCRSTGPELLIMALASWEQRGCLLFQLTFYC